MNKFYLLYYLEMVVPFVYTEEEYKNLEEENKKLKERDFFKEQAILWRKDYKNEYEKNEKLEENRRTRKNNSDLLLWFLFFIYYKNGELIEYYYNSFREISFEFAYYFC